jgi:hypothetical protein
MFGCGPSAQWLLEIQLRHGPLIRLAAIEPSLNYGPTKVLNCSTASAGSGKRNIKLTTINNPTALNIITTIRLGKSATPSPGCGRTSSFVVGSSSYARMVFIALSFSDTAHRTDNMFDESHSVSDGCHSNDGGSRISLAHCSQNWRSLAPRHTGGSRVRLGCAER